MKVEIFFVPINHYASDVLNEAHIITTMSILTDFLILSSATDLMIYFIIAIFAVMQVIP
jgi:hypothetical protein